MLTRTTTKARDRREAVERDPRWAIVRARGEGTFYYSVKTTGVYCRPSCAARPARPENVAFHATTADARAAGFRACKRCQPELAPTAERRSAQVARLCRFIESRAEPPTLVQLAERAGLSVFHMQRIFKAVTGVTPRAYAAAHRARKVRDELATRATVTDAIYGAGYSPATFYGRSAALLGMTPTKFRAGGADVRIRFAIGACSLGAILVAASDRGVCAILFGDDAEQLALDLERRFPRAELIGADAAFERVVAAVVGMIECPAASTTLPLDIQGTAFQQRVWAALCAIPPGATRSYRELAAAIGAPKAVRAVARACASNALAVAIPCHRVVRSDGDLAGYRWGVARKAALLARETSP